MSTTLGGSLGVTFPDGTVQSTAIVGKSLATGTQATALGVGALNSNTGGTNTAVGYQAGYLNNTGTGMASLGYQALYNNTGSNSTAMGYQAAYSNTSGAAITAFGYQAAYSNTTGVQNVAIGPVALYTNTVGTQNTAVGYQSLYSNTNGIQNTAMGQAALLSNTSGSNNTAIGQGSMLSNTTGGSNSALGMSALYSNVGGAYNTAMGQQALYSNTSANANTAVGYQAGYSNTTGAINCYLGYQAGYSNTTGAANVFLGYQAGYTNSTGNNNTFVGIQAGQLATGNYNTFIGDQCGNLITTGAQNTILGVYNGNQNGLNIATASNYIVLSDGAGNPNQVWDGSNWMFGGPTYTSYGALTLSPFGTGANSSVALIWNSNITSSTVACSFRYQNSASGSITYTNTTTTYNTASDYRLKENVQPMTGALSIVEQLNPVTYNWKLDGSAGQGFIAHELQAVVPECVTGEKDAINEDGSINPQQIDTSFLVATLTAAIQEQQQLITQLTTRIAALEAK